MIGATRVASDNRWLFRSVRSRHCLASKATGVAFTVLDPKAALGAEFVGENGLWPRSSGFLSAYSTHAAAAPSFNVTTQPVSKRACHF